MPGFIDEAQVHVKGGDGGAGAVSFRREAHVAKGGPDGGDGGSGGSVWLVVDHNVASLYGFRDHPHRRAGSGTHGMGKGRHGRSGPDLEVPVPEGTVVRDPSGAVLADLAGAGDRWLAARGGQGGRGNARFLSNRRRAPAFAEQGEVGEEWWLNLELKLMADVALVGFPNAGKSTLIGRISAAKPKVANYPFTTLEPHLGVVRFDDQELVVADIPGLIEGASEGRGLGHRFLRHIERARVLLVLIDLASSEGRAPAVQESVLLDELGRYQPALLQRPRVVVGSIADMAGDVEWDGARISAITGEGLRALLGRLAELVSVARAARPDVGTFVIHRPEPGGVAVDRDVDGAFVVRGRPAERAVALSDLTNVQALSYAQQRLRSLGVDRALSRAGARPGDVVRVGTFEFEYEPD
ncbi:MAG TPA: GTPase ObgE [Acidimicrobiales bacterium]